MVSYSYFMFYHFRIFANSKSFYDQNV